MVIRVAPAFAGLALALAACTSPSGAAVLPPTSVGAAPPPSSVVSALPTTVGSGTGEVPALPVAPVDATLIAISKSSMGPDAKSAFDLCVRPGDETSVAGMALVPSAHRVRSYMLTNGNEPELQDDSPVWVIQFHGVIAVRSGLALNPVCVVKNGEATVFMPYGLAGDPASQMTPQGFVAPTLALPSIVP